jgi:hypothetical protein
MNQPKMSRDELIAELRRRKSDNINTQGVIEPFDMYALAVLQLNIKMSGDKVCLERIR